MFKLATITCHTFQFFPTHLSYPVIMFKYHSLIMSEENVLRFLRKLFTPPLPQMFVWEINQRITNKHKWRMANMPKFECTKHVLTSPTCFSKGFYLTPFIALIWTFFSQLFQPTPPKIIITFPKWLYSNYFHRFSKIIIKESWPMNEWMFTQTSKTHSNVWWI